MLTLAAVFGCSVGVHPTAAPARQPDLAIAASPRTATVSIAVEDRSAAAYGLSYLRELDWDAATATLSNGNPGLLPTPLTQTSAATVNPTTKARTASVTFSPVTATTGYTLQLDLKRNGQTIATGTNANFTVSAGANPITVTLALNANGQLAVSIPNPTAANNGVSDAISTYSRFNIVRAAGGTTTGSALGTDPTSATFGYLAGLETDADGNLYAVDSGSNRLRFIPPGGPTSVIAGGGSGGLGDGGPATQATFLNPAGLVRDPASGVLYLCDTGNNRVRFIRPNGLINTVAGGGADTSASVTPATNANLSGPYDITADAAGNVYFTEIGNGRVRRA